MREYAKERGLLWLEGGDYAASQYQMAIEQYERDGAAGPYMEKLLALGVPAADIRYLVANPGRAICVLH
jgi:hypothetical protein